MSGAALSAHVVVERPGFRLDVELHLEPGEVVAVMGPSGAGKSTLLGAIAGLIRPTSGEVSIGRNVVASARRSTPPARRGAVLLGQEARLFPHLTARANVAFGLRAQGLSRADADRDADEWLWRVGLPGSGDRRPSQLSGGQQQRVAVARALAVQPRVLLLDEPLTSLDPETAGDIRAMVAEQLVHAHATAVVVTHDVVDAAAMAGRLAVLEAGRVVQEGTVRAVLAAPATRFVAALAGVNRVEGALRDGRWHAAFPAGDVVLTGTVAAAFAPGSAPAAAAAAAASGPGSAPAPALPDGTPVAATFRPSDVRLATITDSTWTGVLRRAELERPVPGEWSARVVRLEQLPGAVRVHTAEPAVAVDVAVDEAAELGLRLGSAVRLHVRERHVRLQPLRPMG
ncbi:ATP-binding cassette domain-containing protein [Microbacterium sp. 1P10UB]|uniref:ABC transporter ATP-binding protein n=1 Tax=unclassified Microbacterium TaxID=2609290 RepID=UPI00399F3493